MMSSNESSDDVNLKDPTGFLNLDEFGTHPNVFRTIHYPLLSTCLLPSHLPLLVSVDDARIFLLHVIPNITVGMTWSKGDGSTVTFDCTGYITKNWMMSLIFSCKCLSSLFLVSCYNPWCMRRITCSRRTARTVHTEENKWDFAWTRQARSWQEAVGRLSDRRKVSFF